MNGLDIFIIGAFLASALIGALRGFTKEILSLFSWGGSISLSYIFLPVCRGFFAQYISNPMMVDGVTYFCLFIAFLILLSIIAGIIAGYIHESSFRGVDHSLGFGFGMIRGVVVISVVELLFSTFTPRQFQSENVQSARFIPMARKGGDILLQLLPSSLRATILEQATKVEQQMTAKLQENLNQAVPYLSQGAGSPQGQKGEMLPSPLHNVPGEDVRKMPNYPYQFPPSEQSMQKNQLMNSEQGTMGSQMGGAQDAQGAQGAQPQVIQPQSVPAQPGTVVIRPFQTTNPPMAASGTLETNSGFSPAPKSPSPAASGLGRSALPQDKRSTVDKLSRLSPQSAPSAQDNEDGYTKGQRSGMDRLLQTTEED